jgi:hypothetical protein
MTITKECFSEIRSASGLSAVIDLHGRFRPVPFKKHDAALYAMVKFQTAMEHTDKVEAANLGFIIIDDPLAATMSPDVLALPPDMRLFMVKYVEFRVWGTPFRHCRNSKLFTPEVRRKQLSILEELTTLEPRKEVVDKILEAIEYLR